MVFERYLISRSGMKGESPDVEIRMCWQDSLHTCTHACIHATALFWLRKKRLS